MGRLRLFSAGLGPILQEVFIMEECLGFWKDVVITVFSGSDRKTTG